MFVWERKIICLKDNLALVYAKKPCLYPIFENLIITDFSVLQTIVVYDII